MTPKQRVLQQFPSAVCETNGNMGYQVVNIQRYNRAFLLGRSYTSKRSAWANAASHLRPMERSSK